MEQVVTAKPTLSCLFNLSPGVSAIIHRHQTRGVTYDNGSKTKALNFCIHYTHTGYSPVEIQHVIINFVSSSL